MRSPILSSGQNIKLRYVVDLGDTVKNISDGFKVSKNEILTTNKIKSSRSLKAGTNLIIYK